MRTISCIILFLWSNSFVVAIARPCSCFKNSVYCSTPMKLSQIFRTCKSNRVFITFAGTASLHECARNVDSLFMNPDFVINWIDVSAATRKSKVCACFANNDSHCRLLRGCDDYCNNLNGKSIEPSGQSTTMNIVTEYMSGVIIDSTPIADLPIIEDVLNVTNPSTVEMNVLTTTEAHGLNATQKYDFKIKMDDDLEDDLPIRAANSIDSISSVALYVSIGSLLALAVISGVCFMLLCWIWKNLHSNIGGTHIHSSIQSGEPLDKIEEKVEQPCDTAEPPESYFKIGGCDPRVEARIAAGSAALLRNKNYREQSMFGKRLPAQVVKLVSQSLNSNEIVAFKAMERIGKVSSVKTIARGVYEIEFRSSESAQRCLTLKEFSFDGSTFYASLPDVSSSEQFVSVPVNTPNPWSDDEEAFLSDSAVSKIDTTQHQQWSIHEQPIFEPRAPKIANVLQSLQIQELSDQNNFDDDKVFPAFGNNSGGIIFGKVLELHVDSLTNEAELIRLLKQFGKINIVIIPEEKINASLVEFEEMSSIEQCLKAQKTGCLTLHGMLVSAVMSNKYEYIERKGIESTVATNVIVIYFILSKFGAESEIRTICSQYGKISRFVLHWERSMRCAILGFDDVSTANLARNAINGFIYGKGRDQRGYMGVFGSVDSFEYVARGKEELDRKYKLNKHLNHFTRRTSSGMSYSSVMEKASPASPVISKMIQSTSGRKLFQDSV